MNGASSYKSSTIYKYIRETKFSLEALGQYNEPGPEIDSQLLKRIRDALEKMPFASSHVVADILNESQSIVYRHLTNRLGLVYKQFLWITHELNFQQKKIV